MAEFVKNLWYAAAWSREIVDRPFGRRLLGEPVVLFRQADGTIAALSDRCPHRLVPLSMGEVVEGQIRCGYHGMEFDGTGKCVHIPGQSIIPPKAFVPNYPAKERYGMVWVWMGDPALASEDSLPMLEKYDEPGWDVIDGGYQHHPSNYLNIVENLMDPAHTTFVHKQTIGISLASDEPVQMEKADDHIVAFRWLKAIEPSPNDRQLMDFGGQKIDRGQFFYYYPPAISRVDISVLPSGLEPTDANLDKGLRTFSYKFLTPESASATHFFWMHVRNYKVGDQAWADRMRGILEFTFLEDKEIETAMQRSQEETGVRQYTALEVDRAPMVAVRMIERMIEAEKAPA